ncbi:hypothetical protein NOCD_22305, partial [Nocardioides cavernae]
MQRWKTGADIGVMNPGGLRDDLIGTGDGCLLYTSDAADDNVKKNCTMYCGSRSNGKSSRCY